MGVLALPLIAVLAMVMFFAWGQPANHQAQAASQGTAVAMELSLPASAEVGSTFTISVAGNLTPSVPIYAFHFDIVTGAGVTYNGSNDCLSEVKVGRVDGATLPICRSEASAAGGHTILVAEVGVPPQHPLDVATDAKVVLANLSYRCDTVGVKKITLPNGSVDPDGASFIDTNLNSIPIKSELQDGVVVADSATITCTPQININVVDQFSGAKLAGTCWRISYGPAKVAHDVVGDDNGGVKPDCGEPSNVKLSDKDPSAGNLRITITSAQRVQFGDIWHAQMSFSPISGGLDPTNYECDLSLGKCTIGPVAVGGLVVDLGDLPLTAAQPAGGSAGRLAGTIAAIATLAVALTVAAWYARRRWL